MFKTTPAHGHNAAAIYFGFYPNHCTCNSEFDHFFSPPSTGHLHNVTKHSVGTWSCSLLIYFHPTWAQCRVKYFQFTWPAARLIWIFTFSVSSRTQLIVVQTSLDYILIDSGRVTINVKQKCKWYYSSCMNVKLFLIFLFSLNGKHSIYQGNDHIAYT